MKGDLVSVVIPCRNRSGFLTQVLNNLLGQLEEGDEVLVADNGSSDGLQALIESYGGAVNVVNVPYKGAWMRNTVLNRGVEAAANDLIIVLDADTVPQPTCIQRLRDAGGVGVYVSGLVLLRVLDTAPMPEIGGMRMSMAAMGTAPPEQVIMNVREGRVQGVMGACLCFHRGDWRRVGGYTEAYDGRWGLGETDYYLKLHYAGVRMVSLDRFNPLIPEGCVAVHIDDVTQTKRGITKRRLREKEENRKLLLSLIPRYEKGMFVSKQGEKQNE